MQCIFINLFTFWGEKRIPTFQRKFFALVPEILVTPPTPDMETLQKQDLNKKEREAFFRTLMANKKPMLQKEKVQPSPVDMTTEESISKYIAQESKAEI